MVSDAMGPNMGLLADVAQPLTNSSSIPLIFVSQHDKSLLSETFSKHTASQAIQKDGLFLYGCMQGLSELHAQFATHKAP